MTFDLRTYGAQRTEIEDASGGRAVVIHRPVSLGWRASWDAEAALHRRAMPRPPAVPDSAEDEALDAYDAAVAEFTSGLAAWQATLNAAKVKFFRRMLADLVIGFEGITVDGRELPVSTVLDVLTAAGGEYGPGSPLIALGEAVAETGRVGPAAEKS
jgi:hypothetical protein